MSDQKTFCPSHPNPLCPMKEGKGRCGLCGYDFSGQKLDKESRGVFWEQARQEGEQKKVTAQPTEPLPKDEEAASRREADEAAWRKAESTYTEAGYSAYLNEHTDGKYRSEANRRKIELQAQQRLEADAAAAELRANPEDRAAQEAAPYQPALFEGTSNGTRAEGWYVITPFVGHQPNAPADLAEFQFIRRRGVVYGNASGGQASRFAGQAPMLQVQLQTMGLLHEGQRVHGAVSKMALRQTWWKTLGNRMFGANWLEEIHVRMVTSPTKNMTGASTTLGLALGVLMAGTQPRTRLVIATGELGTSVGNSTSTVEPIGGIDQKIAEVCRRWSKRPENVLFLVPFQDRQGKPLIGTKEQRESAFAAAFQSDISKLAALGVTLRPVETLEEAASAVGATELAPTPRDRAVIAAALSGLAAGIAIWSFGQWHDRPIDLHWMPVGDQKMIADQAPFFRSKTTIHPENDADDMRHSEDGSPFACGGDIVSVRVAVPENLKFPVKMAAIYFSDRISGKDRPRVVLMGDRGEVNPGESPYVDAFKTDNYTETNGVVIVAERWSPLEINWANEINRVLYVADGGVERPKYTNVTNVMTALSERFRGRAITGKFELIKRGEGACQ